jgi:hypothetical protein
LWLGYQRGEELPWKPEMFWGFWGIEYNFINWNMDEEYTAF